MVSTKARAQGRGGARPRPRHRPAAALSGSRVRQEGKSRERPQDDPEEARPRDDDDDDDEADRRGPSCAQRGDGREPGREAEEQHEDGEHVPDPSEQDPAGGLSKIEARELRRRAVHLRGLPALAGRTLLKKSNGADQERAHAGQNRGRVELRTGAATAKGRGGCWPATSRANAGTRSTNGTCSSASQTSPSRRRAPPGKGEHRADREPERDQPGPRPWTKRHGSRHQGVSHLWRISARPASRVVGGPSTHHPGWGYGKRAPGRRGHSALLPQLVPAPPSSPSAHAAQAERSARALGGGRDARHELRRLSGAAATAGSVFPYPHPGWGAEGTTRHPR